MDRVAALITGANGGIGQSLVRTFHDAGYFVIATDLNDMPTDMPADCYISADLKRTVEDRAYFEQKLANLKSALGEVPLKALINNAAVQILNDATALSRDDWRTSIDINVLAPFFWAQALLPSLESANGSIINIGSIHATLSKPRFSAYATSKAALHGLTRSLAIEWGGRIRINAIAPAAISTDMLESGFKGREDSRRELDAYHPLGRIGQPAEVATLALFLASDPAAFINGAILTLDGGISGCLHDPGS